MSASDSAVPIEDRFRHLGPLLLLVAVLRLVAQVSMPSMDGPLPPDRLAASTLLLVAHAAAYHFGIRVRARTGTGGYLTVQGALVGAIGLFSQSIWLAIALFIALGTQTAALLRRRASPIIVAIVSLLGFAVSTGLGTSIYRGAAVALVLAMVGVVMAAVSGIWHARRSDGAGRNTAESKDQGVETSGAKVLTDRESEVLRLASEGLTSREIAIRLGIVERTVKAHLAATYRKLGVESRAAATAAATQRGLI